MKFPKHLGPLIEAEMDILLNANSEYLCTIYARWQDEKKHEDFNDYIAAIKKNIPEAIDVHKRPFGLTVISNGCDVRISVNIASIKWKVTSMPKADVVADDSDLVTLLSICTKHNVDSTIARRKLRKANIAKPGKQWAWALTFDLSTIIETITK